jgi:hypothetical protein
MENRISILTALMAAFSFSASASTNQPRLVESFGEIPLAFTENTGQLDPQVKDSSGAKKMAYGSDRADTQVRPYESFADRADTQVRPYESFAVNLSFLGANPSPEIVSEDSLPGKSNYFIGNDPAKWRTGVPN